MRVFALVSMAIVGLEACEVSRSEHTDLRTSGAIVSLPLHPLEIRNEIRLRRLREFLPQEDRLECPAYVPHGDCFVVQTEYCADESVYVERYPILGKYYVSRQTDDVTNDWSALFGFEFAVELIAKANGELSQLHSDMREREWNEPYGPLEQDYDALTIERHAPKRARYNSSNSALSNVTIDTNSTQITLLFVPRPSAICSVGE